MNKQFLHMQKLAGLITESEYKQLTTLNESDLRNKIRELVQSSLDEAKKKKKEKDVAPQEDTETTTDTTSTETTPTDSETTTSTDTTATTPTDTAPQADTTGEVDIDPKIKAIQDSLQKALANAKQLGDEKLVKQIGNTLTMLVRTQVLGTQQAVTENELPSIIQRTYPKEQNVVVKQYLEDLRNYESTHTDDLDDLKNLATAIDLYYKELINKI